MSFFSELPASWRTDVVVRRSGGHGPRGAPLPPVEIVVRDCLIGPRSSTEPVAGSSLASSDMSIFRDPDPAFAFEPADRIIVPVGALNAGEWSVDGRSKEFPLGSETPIRAGV